MPVGSGQPASIASQLSENNASYLIGPDTSGSVDCGKHGVDIIQ